MNPPTIIAFFAMSTVAVLQCIEKCTDRSTFLSILNENPNTLDYSSRQFSIHSDIATVAMYSISIYKQIIFILPQI